MLLPGCYHIKQKMQLDTGGSQMFSNTLLIWIVCSYDCFFT